MIYERENLFLYQNFTFLLEFSFAALNYAQRQIFGTIKY